MRFLFFLIGICVILALAACGGSAPELATPARPPLIVPTQVTVSSPVPTISPMPTPALVTATPEPANAQPAATAASQGGPTTAALAATEIPVAPVAPSSKLVGTYSGILPAADAAGRVVTLDLALDGSATLTSQLIGKGSPSVETGTWVEKSNNAVVTFTQLDGTAEDNRITWTFQDGKLATTVYDQSKYGTAGLPLSRVGTGEIVSASFGGVSFSFDSALATSAEGKFLAPVPVEQAPALGGGAPESIQFVFDNQTLPQYFDPNIPQVYVYPVEGLKALDPSVAKGVESLEKMIAAQQAPDDASIFVFPLIPASQVFHAQTKFLQFGNGSGFSFVTYYAQDVSPIQPERVFYTFQGITLDGEYYVSVFWHVSSPALPAAPTALSGAEYNKFAKGYEAYLNTVIQTLNSLPPGGFDPNLTLLNNMTQSINASPIFPTPTPAPETSTPEATSASAQGQATPAGDKTTAAQAAPEPQSTPTAAAAATPAMSQEMHSADFEGVSFAFANSLAQSSQGTTIPAVPVDTNAPMLGGGSPEQVAFSFDGKPITSDVSPFQPQVRVYPADGLKALDASVARDVLALKTLLSTKPATLDDAAPVFPPFNAEQVLQPQIKYLKFKDGQGVRFVTFYSQNVAPVTNDGLFYTFQGLSSDGKKYVTAFWPVKTEKLPDSFQDAKIADLDAWAKQFDGYRAGTEKTLDELPPQGFSPDLASLDQMIESIQVPQ